MCCKKYLIIKFYNFDIKNNIIINIIIIIIATVLNIIFQISLFYIFVNKLLNKDIVIIHIYI